MKEEKGKIIPFLRPTEKQMVVVPGLAGVIIIGCFRKGAAKKGQEWTKQT